MTSPASSGFRSRRTARILLVALPLIAVAAIALMVVTLSGVGARKDPLAAAALRYANRQMVWMQGPTVRSSRVVRLSHLELNLRRSVPASVRQDINVQQLLQQYGSGREVGMVVLQGVFNTLPPDEGVVVHGVAVVLIDAASKRPLLIMD